MQVLVDGGTTSPEITQAVRDRFMQQLAELNGALGENIDGWAAHFEVTSFEARCKNDAVLCCFNRNWREPDAMHNARPNAAARQTQAQC